MTATVHTVYSSYEVDTENKRIRRILGVNPPTNAIADDNVWRDYTKISWFYESLFIEWADLNPETGNPRGTRTSDVQSVEGDLGIEKMKVAELP